MLTPIEIIALAVAAIILIKIVMLIAFPKHMMNLARAYLKKSSWHNYWSYIYLALFIIIAYFVFTAVPISHIAATFFLFGLYLHFAIFLVFPRDLRTLTAHAIKHPERLWLAISFSLIIAVFTIYAILL